MTKILKIPMATKVKEKNVLLKTIGTKEAIKLIEKEKKINIENIFIKSK